MAMNSVLVNDSESKTMSVQKWPRPTPGKNQLLVKCLACGICGSDIHMLQNGIADKCVMGHEFVCQVCEIGPDSSRDDIAVGDRVCSLPTVIDEKGRGHFTGGDPKYPGGYAEFMLLNPNLCVKVPPECTDDEAAVTEPMAVAVHAVHESGAKPEDVVPIVYGCGPIGLCTVIYLKKLGFTHVIAVNRSAFRRDLAKHFGADIIVDPNKENPFKVWRKAYQAKLGVDDAGWRQMARTGKLRPPVVFENVGVPNMIQKLGELAPPRTKIVIVGVCMEPDTFRPDMFVQKALNLVFVIGYSYEEFVQALQMCAARKPDVRAMITGQVGLNDVEKAFKLLGTPEKHAKILVKPHLTASSHL